MSIKSFFKRIGKDIESLWVKEEPDIVAALEAALQSLEPVWATALGKLVLSTVESLQGMAAAGNGVQASIQAAEAIAKAAAADGVAASRNSIDLLVKAAVAKLKADAPVPI